MRASRIDAAPRGYFAIPECLWLQFPKHRSGKAQLGKNSNGAVLKRAEDEGFDLLLPTDKNARCQQNLANWKISIVVPANRLGGLSGSVLLGSDEENERN
jgi:hypothetical protein